MGYLFGGGGSSAPSAPAQVTVINVQGGGDSTVVTLPAGTTSLDVTNSHVNWILVKDPDTTFRIGLTAGGSEIAYNQDIAGFWDFTINQYFEGANTLYFTGVTTQTQIKISKVNVQ